jgi:hypothetical protein
VRILAGCLALVPATISARNIKSLTMTAAVSKKY